MLGTAEWVMTDAEVKSLASLSNRMTFWLWSLRLLTAVEPLKSESGRQTAARPGRRTHPQRCQRMLLRKPPRATTAIAPWELVVDRVRACVVGEWPRTPWRLRQFGWRESCDVGVFSFF